MQSKFLMVLLLMFQPPPTAVLECTADTSLPGESNRDEKVLQTGEGKTVLLSFRMAAAENWKIERALVLIHFAATAEPSNLKIAAIQDKWTEKTESMPALTAFQTVAEHSKPDGWITIPVPIEFLSSKYTGIALRGSGQAFHSRRTVQFSPYLVVQRSQ